MRELLRDGEDPETETGELVGTTGGAVPEDVRTATDELRVEMVGTGKMDKEERTVPEMVQVTCVETASEKVVELLNGGDAAFEVLVLTPAPDDIVKCLELMLLRVG